MAGFLDVATVIPFWSLLVGVIAFMALIGYILREYQMDRKYCPEKKLFIKARKDGFPIIELTDIGSGNSVFELGTKKNADDINFDSKFSGIRIDPILTSVGCEPKRFAGGLDIYGYAYENWLPQTHRNHLAHRAISEYFHTKAKDLEFLTDIEFVALISTPETHLSHDVMIYINKYFKNTQQEDSRGRTQTKAVRRFQIVDEEEFVDLTLPNGTVIQSNNPTFGQLVWVEQEVTPQELVNRIQEIKREISNLPIAFGWYSGTEAFKNNAYAYSAQDLEMLLIIHDKLQMADMLKKFNVMIYAIAALIVMIGGGLAFYIINMVKH